MMNVDLKLYSTNKMERFKWTNVMIIEITIQVEATHKVTKTNGMVKLANATWQCSLESP
jgi:hypothetical protein